MKLRLLSLFALVLVSQAVAVTVSGRFDGDVPAQTRLGGWAVRPSGQPVQEIASAAVSGGTFTLTLPGGAPPTQAQVPVDNRLSWPGLLDFGKASAPAQASEMKFFVYRDTNGNGERDDNEPMREVRLNAGRAALFVVWASSAVTVTGSNGYQAALQPGWNALTLDIRGSVTVKPADATTRFTVSGQ